MSNLHDRLAQFGDDTLLDAKDVMAYLRIDRTMLNRMISGGFLEPAISYSATGLKRWRFKELRDVALGELSASAMRPNEPIETIHGKVLLELVEAAETFSMSSVRFAKLAKRGELPAPVIIGRRPYWRAAELTHFTRNLTRWANKKKQNPYSIREADRPAVDAPTIPAALAAIGRNLMEYKPHKECVVYFLLCGDVIVYVGSSTCLPLRVGSHGKAKAFDRVLYFLVEPERMLAVESEMIRVFQPPLNVMGNSVSKKRAL